VIFETAVIHRNMGWFPVVVQDEGRDGETLLVLDTSLMH